MKDRDARPSLLRLEGRLTPATLDIAGGALTFTDLVGNETNNLTVSVTSGIYTFNDSATVITLGPGAVSAGWRGSGTHTVTGTAPPVATIEIDVMGGTNTVNLRSINTGDTTTVDGGTGTMAVNISSSAPVNNGSLAGIKADVTVNAGAATSLWVADVTTTTGHSNVVIGGAGITGLGPNAVHYTGTLTSLRVSGSNSPGLAETFTVSSPPAAYFRLDTLAGDDTVTVSGDVTGDFYLGTGDDTLTVLAGVTLTGDVHTGGQPGDVVFANMPGYGTITGTVD